MLKLYLLGRPQIVYNDQPVTAFISDKAMTLLCYLALEQRTHARETLAGLLWGEFKQKHAKSNLRQAIHNIQKLLPNYLTTTRKTVAFRSEMPHWIDVTAFEKQMSDALEQAVSLYQGDLLQGVMVGGAPDFEGWLRGEQERYRLLVVRGLQLLKSHHLERGAWDSAETTLRHLLQIEPWQEEAQRQLIDLLARRGDYEAALRQFEFCQQTLADELGIEPQPATIDLVRRIRTARRRPAPQLPQPTLPLVGRQPELATLTRLLRTRRLVTLLGMGGSGKTRLALAIAHQMRHHFFDGMTFVPLTSVTRADQIQPVIADHIGAQGRNVESAIIDRLRGRDWLLVLDNVEHLLPDSADFVATLLQQLPQLTILITSRERLRLRDEQLFDVQGLPLDSDAVQLFVQTAQQMQPAFVVSAENQSHITRIAQLVDGLPLALELAGATIRHYHPSAIAQAIECNLDALHTQYRDTPPRHATLRAVFDHSWATLTAHAQADLTRLTIFRDTFSANASTSVADVNEDALQNLTDHALVRRTGKRYSLHPVIHAYASERLTDSVHWQQRHATYFADQLTENEEALDSQMAYAVSRVFAPDSANLIAAFEVATEQGEVRLFGRMLPTFNRLFASWGQANTVIPLFEQAISQLRPKDAIHRDILARLHLAHSELLGRLGKGHEAETAANKALTLSPTHAATAHHQIAYTLRLRSAYAEAEEHLIAAQAGATHPVLQTAVANELGVVAMFNGEFDKAHDHLQQALALARAHRLGRTATIKVNLALLSRNRGERGIAVTQLQEAVELFAEMGDPWQLFVARINLGFTYIGNGDYGRCRAILQEAQTAAEAFGARHVLGLIAYHLGLNDLRIGNWEPALAQLAQAEHYFAEIEDWGNVAAVHIQRSFLYGERQKPQEALKSAQRALSLEPEDPNDRALMQLALALAFLQMDQLEDAEMFGRQALRSAENANTRRYEYQAACAAIAHAQQDQATALTLCEQLLPAINDNKIISEDNLGLVYRTCYQILHSVSDPRAVQLFTTAQRQLTAFANTIDDPDLRDIFWHTPPTHVFFAP